MLKDCSKLKMNSCWETIEVTRATVKLLGQSFSQGHYPLIKQQARKGFIYFINFIL